MELYEQIRREFEHGAGTVRGVSRTLGVHRRAVRQALVSAVPAERKVPERERPKLLAAIAFIDEILEADRKAPRKQRHTSRRIYDRISSHAALAPPIGYGMATNGWNWIFSCLWVGNG